MIYWKKSCIFRECMCVYLSKIRVGKKDYSRRDREQETETEKWEREMKERRREIEEKRSRASKTENERYNIVQIVNSRWGMESWFKVVSKVNHFVILLLHI